MTTELTPSRTVAGSLTQALLVGGAIAGPVFLAVSLAQAFTRDGFDLSRHPLSLLSNGAFGWLQIANFVVAGLLVVAFAAGLRRVLYPGRGGTWGPLLIGGYGFGLIAAGVFTADPADGFPAGTPAGTLEQLSWHSVLHGIAAVVSFTCLVAACFVLARRFAVDNRRGWTWYSIATGVIAFALAGWPGAGASVTLVLGSAVGWAWLAALALHLRTTPAVTQEVGTQHPSV